jgi:FAD/FMN-containing dehydrogenase
MKDEIKKFWKGDIEDSDATLDKYSKDASIFEVRPALVLFPKDSIDIQNLVKWVNDNKKNYENLSITMRAAGTCMSGGPLNDSLILDTTKYMNRIGIVKKVPSYKMLPKFPGAKEVAISGEVTVEPGVFYRDLEPKTLEQGLILPCYTASKSINAIGGMVGNNSAGELTLKYGKTEDYIKELSVIFADGHEYTVRPMTRRELYNKITEATFEGQVYKQIFDLIKENRAIISAGKPQVSKNSAGYNLWNIQGGVDSDEEVFDLCQLFVGSQGTLGIVTKITLALVEKSKMSKLAVVFLKDLSVVGNLVEEILKTSPLTLESYDDKTFGLAMKFFKDFVKAKGFWGTIKFGFHFIPEFFMVLTGGVPKLILLVEYDGESEEEINKKCQNLIQKIAHFKLKTHITKNEAEAKKYWDMRRDSFALLRKHVAGLHTAPFIDDVIVRPEFLPKFLPEVEAVLKEYKNMIFTIAGHAGNGNFHIIPLMDFKDPKTAPTILEVSERIYHIVIKYQGSIDAEHNDGIIRTPYLSKMFGAEVCALFQDTKTICDPKNIFNPHKKVGEGKYFLTEHIIKEDHVPTHSS